MNLAFVFSMPLADSTVCRQSGHEVKMHDEHLHSKKKESTSASHLTTFAKLFGSGQCLKTHFEEWAFVSTS